MDNQLFSIRKPNWLVIFIGIFSILQLRIFGLLFSGLELISLLFSVYQIFFIPRSKVNYIFEDKIYKSMSKLLILWALLQLISDLLNKVELKLSVRGVLTPIIILLTFRFILIIYKYFNYENFFKDFVIGRSSLVLLNLFSQFESLDFALKFGALFAISYICYGFLNNRILKIMLSILFLIGSLFYGIRSSAIIFLFLIVYEFLLKSDTKRLINVDIFSNVLQGIIKFVLILGIFSLGSPLFNTFNFLILKLNPDGARSEVLVSQSENKGGIFSARSEYYVFFDVFKEAPLIGKGSWSRDKDFKYFLIQARKNIKNNVYSERTLIQRRCVNRPQCRPFIPTHSYVLQTIIYAGIFSASFFFYLLSLNLFIISNIRLDFETRLIIIGNIFNTFFSPLAGNNRFLIPIVCLVSLIFINKLNNKNLQLTEE